MDAAPVPVQTTADSAFAMATEGRGVPVAVVVMERVTEEEEAAEREAQQEAQQEQTWEAVHIPPAGKSSNMSTYPPHPPSLLYA